MDQLQLFRIEYLTYNFFKMKEMNLSFQENKWQYLLPMIKFKLLDESKSFGKPGFTTMSFVVFQ